jgi:hypothetical protein
MDIRSFTFDSALSRAFATFCTRLYADEPRWIPPSRRALLAQFSPEFPFFQRPDNEHRHFVARRGRDVIGHVSAFLNSDMRDATGRQIGCLGFFECVEDFDVAEELLGNATEWLKRRDSVARIWGPVNFDIWHGYRCMRRGFEREPFLGEPFNKSYYPVFLEKSGFAVCKTWCSMEVRDRRVLEDVLAKSEPRYQQILDDGYRFQRIDGRDPSSMRLLHALVTRSYEKFLGFTDVDFANFDRIYGTHLRVIDSRFAHFVYDPDGQPGGFAIVYPDPSNAVRAMNGSDNVYAKLKFALRRKQTKRVVVHTVGITPEEIEKRHGLGSALAYHGIRSALDAGFDRAVLALIAEDSLARKIVGDSIDQAEREYALYELMV